MITAIGPLKFKNGILQRTFANFQKIDAYLLWLASLLFYHCQKNGEFADAERMRELRVELQIIAKEIDDIIKKQSTINLNQTIKEFQQGAN